MPIVIDYAVETSPIDAGMIIERCGRLILGRDAVHRREVVSVVLNKVPEQ